MLGCGDDVAWRDTRVVLARPMATACRLDPAAPITVSALGDFAPSANHVEQIDPVRGVFSIERFPLDTRYLRFETGSPDTEAGDVLGLLPATARHDVLLLPLSRSCPSPDFEARARAGAAITALPDGALLIAGGRNDDFGDGSDGAAVSQAFVLPAGAELVEQVEGGMFLRRSGASATVVDDHVLVIGGGAHDRGPAHETFERFDLRTRTFTADVGAVLVHGPRRDHAAIALADNSVLVVGGVSELGEAPLASMERVTEVGAEDAGNLETARTQPTLQPLRDGRVLVIGGLDQDGRVVTTVEAIDPSGQVSTLDASFQPADRAVSTSLVGDRVAWVGCTVSACTVSLLLMADGWVRVVDTIVTLPSLARLSALGLSDGSLLVVGQRRPSDLAQAWRVDPETIHVNEVSASRVPTAMHRLSNGAIAELDATGLSLRREQITSPFDNLPATLFASDPELALDHAGAWDDVDGVLSALPDARADVAGLVFGAFRLTLDVGGSDPSLKLALGDGDRRVDVVVSSSTIAIGVCSVSRPSEDPTVTVERRADQVTLSAGDARAECRVQLPEHVPIHWVASSPLQLSRIRLQRL